MENKVIVKKITGEESIDDFYVLFNNYAYVTDHRMLIRDNYETLFIAKADGIILGIFGFAKISEKYFSDEFFKRTNIFDCDNFFIEQYILEIDRKLVFSYLNTVDFSDTIIHSFLHKKKKKFMRENLCNEKYQKIFSSIQTHKIYKSEIFFQINRDAFINVLI